MVFATAVGLLLAVGRLSDHRWVRVPVSALIEFFRAIPLLVLIFALSSCCRRSVSRSERRSARWPLGLVLYNSPSSRRSSAPASSRSTAASARPSFALGMRKSQVMTLVLLPQAVRRMLPVLIAQLVVLLKDCSLGFIMGYFELLRQARSLVEFFNPDFGGIYTFQLYVAAALFYIVVNLLLSLLARYVERRTRRNMKTAATGRGRAARLTCRWMAAGAQSSV